MFGKKNGDKKIKAFRGKEIRVIKYDQTQPILNLKAGGYAIRLAMNLVEMDAAIQLAFPGDVIATDGKSLSRIMKAMWNEEIPEFELSDELRARLGKKMLPINTGTDDGSAGPLGSRPTNVRREPIYFKDMAPYVAGLGNDVVTTVKRTYNIDD